MANHDQTPTRRPDEHKKYLGGVGAVWLVEQKVAVGWNVALRIQPT
jgi:hypothetical protein